MKLLIAEDDLTSRTMLAAITRKWGYEPIAVEDGEAAWQVMQGEEPPRLLLLDWEMPKLDGLALSQRIRQQESGNPPFIILLTARSETSDIVAGLEAGANEYITKPFDNTELQARLQVGRRMVDLQTEMNEMVATRQVAEEALTATNNRLTALVESLPDAIFFKDGEGRWMVANDVAKKLFKLDEIEWQGKTEEELSVLRPEFKAAHDKCRIDDELAWKQGQLSFFEEHIVDESGEEHVYDVRKIPLFSADGKREGLVIIGRDITDLRKSISHLQLAASVFTHASEGIMITEIDGTIVEVNDAFCQITGYSCEEVVGKKPSILQSGRQGAEFYASMWRDLDEKDYWHGEIWNRHKSGEVYVEMLTINAVRDAQNRMQHYVALFSDITAQKKHQKQLEHIAHYDALTNLPNRVLLADRLHQALTQVQRRGQRLAVTYIDLDGFKIINDTHGHEVGDQLLMTMASRMKLALRDSDTIARLGGDEFVAVLIDLADTKESVSMLTRLLAAAAKPVHVGDLVLQVSASVGVTFYPQEEEVDADQLLRQADQAMYQAKLSGKNRYHIFDAEQDSNLRGHHESLEHIRHALTESEFVLYYQPKVNMRTGEVIGVEALIRWQHPEQGLLSPDAFLPVIEDDPISIELGEWVINTALTQLEAWQAVGLDISVSVNVGALQMQQADFTEHLCELLAAHPGVRPVDLELEVLETSALEDIAHISQVMHASGEMGVNFALDDFGTGYSSLTYLKRLPANQLKIDRSFVRDMLDDPEDLAILEGVLGLATAFRRQVIAEGVESVEHGELLLQLGCELAQGYGIARPMPAANLPGWIDNWQTEPSWSELRPVSRDDLPVLFASVEHRAWIRAIEESLRGERTAPPPLDHHQCRFGQWLDREGKARHEEHPAFQAIESLHLQVHALAAELLKLQTQNRDSEALMRLSELHGLRDALLGQLQELVQGNKR